MNYIFMMHTFVEGGRIRKVFTLDVVGSRVSNNLITVEVRSRPQANVIVLDGAEDLSPMEWLGAVIQHIVDVFREAQ